MIQEKEGYMEKNQKNNWKKYIFAVVWFFVLVVTDQVTKWMAVVHLKDNDAFVLIPGVFELHYLENRGAAFGIFQGKQVLFLIGGVIVCAVVMFLYGKIPSTKRFFALRLCSVLICAGAIGNMIDRIRLGYVVDMIEVEFIKFPVFNVADCFITCGCILMFAHLLLFNQEFWKDDKKKKKRESTEE